MRSFLTTTSTSDPPPARGPGGTTSSPATPPRSGSHARGRGWFSAFVAVLDSAGDSFLRTKVPIAAAPSAAPVGVAQGTAPGGLSSTDRLRRSRLRAAAGFLAALQVVAVIWTLLEGEARWPLHAVAACALAAAFAWLSRDGPIARARLRAPEFAVFGLMVATIAVVQFQQMLAASGRGDAVGLMAEVKNALIGSLILTFAYAMLIPSSRRTAAAVVLVIAAAPVAIEGILFHRHPEALRFAREARVLMLSGMNTLLASIAASLAIFGTHVLNSLRQEVFEARRLNQYQLGELIGVGGMGQVYRAEHRLLRRTCAIKLIHPWADRDPRALERFEREVRATARLSHPNIVEIYDYGLTDDGTFYYVMESLNGLSLGELVECHGPLPAGRVIYLLTQVCEGLAEAHAAGLIHRDIKPTNLFAAHIGRRYDVAKVLDFGLVKDTHLVA